MSTLLSRYDDSAAELMSTRHHVVGVVREQRVLVPSLSARSACASVALPLTFCHLTTDRSVVERKSVPQLNPNKRAVTFLSEN
jgi:hypothetical protein